MFNNITLLNNCKPNIIKKALNYINRYRNCAEFKIKQLKHDVFEHNANSPELLSYNPPIISGKFDAGIKDSRFENLTMEFHSYNYEGYDTKFPNNYVYIDSNGDRRLKPHIYIRMVEIKPEFARQGVYTNTIKKLTDLLKNDKECQGRIILEARKIESPTMTKIPSPALAHWKCGFRFVNEENNKIMKQVLRGELPPEKAPEGTMFFLLD